MTKTQEYLQNLPNDKKDLFNPIFGNVEKFYDTIYDINRNEHIIDNQKPDRYEDRLKVIQQIKDRIATLLDSFGFDGKELMADIASDYFEDYVNYKDSERIKDQNEFINIIKKITSQ